jgi:LysR family transcriptional regulator, mexEF-oprN operon transcriptional activator
MRVEDHSKLDLNLLVAFDAVMAERSVKQAAVRLGMNAPAVSQALGRLKDALGAELFIRAGHGLQPTPRALQMWPGVRSALGLIKDATRHGECFDLATVNSTILLDLPAGTDALITPQLAQRVAKAPGLQFRVSSARAIHVLNDLHYGTSWLAFDYRPVTAECYHCELLTEQELRLVARKGHPALATGLTRELYQTLPQVAVAAVRTTSVLPVNERLEEIGMTRVVKFTVPGLLSMLQMVAAGEVVASLPLCTAKLCQQWADIEIHDLPFAIGKVQFFMVWHERFDADPAHTWLRDNIREICAEL